MKDVIIAVLLTLVIISFLKIISDNDSEAFEIARYKEINSILIEQNRELTELNTKLHQRAFEISQAAIKLTQEVELLKGGKIEKKKGHPGP